MYLIVLKSGCCTLKKILIIGAAGTIGVTLTSYLLMEGKYEITLLDLKNKKAMNRLKRFKKRVNIIYGDINNTVLIESLVKHQDYIINLASALPPLSNMKKGLSDAIDYNGCVSLIKAINYYNPECHVFYASTTCMYKDIENPSVTKKINLDEFDFYSKSKLEAERIIKGKLKNYTIYRIPLVLSDINKDKFIYNISKNSIVDAITKEDVALAFVRGIQNSKLINRKTFNVSGITILYQKLLNKILEYNGLSIKYICSRLFLEKDYYSPVCKDSNVLNEIIGYKTDTIEDYYRRLRQRGKKRKISKILAKPFIKRK
jgi:nucleoside-diphosphate-sugar epimerase